MRPTWGSRLGLGGGLTGGGPGGGKLLKTGGRLLKTGGKSLEARGKSLETEMDCWGASEGVEAGTDFGDTTCSCFGVCSRNGDDGDERSIGVHSACDCLCKAGAAV